MAPLLHRAAITRRVAIIRRIATRAARHALPSRQYGLWVKCGHAGMWAKAVVRKLGAPVPLCVEGELGPHVTQCRMGRGLLPYQVVS